MVALLLILLTVAGVRSAGAAVSVPKRVGQCATTTISWIGTRLAEVDDAGKETPIPGSGSAVSFADKLYQVSYDTVPAVEASRVGDRAQICLRNIPKGCPKGDERGKVYRTTNLRTHRTWTLPDAQHMCGGA